MGSAKIPGPPTIPMQPPSTRPETLGSPYLVEAGLQSQQRSLAAQGKGLNNTVQTSMQGAPTPATAKTLLS